MNISQKGKIIFLKDSLSIETYVIGYKNEGEAILFFVRADSNICFSGLVDCYALKDINKIEEILNANEVNELNFICWSHPDYDHSRGLKDIIEQYCSANTYIWIPEGVDSKEIECSDEVRSLFASLKEGVYHGLNVYSTSDNKDMMFYNKICFRKDYVNFPLEIISYAPNSQFTRKQTYLDQFIKNDRSIFCVVSLGDAHIWLTGDIEDTTIEKMPEELQGGHIHILKIPHHGSDTSTRLLDFEFDKCDVACSTVYRKGNICLPKETVMEKYRNRATRVVCTGKKDKNLERKKYGILKVTTNILKNSYTTKLEGNAEDWSSS